MILRNYFYKSSVSKQALQATPKPKWTVNHLRKKDGSIKPTIFIQVLR